MVKYSDDELDAVFGALADRTRRDILESLAGGELAVSELAAPHDMSLPGFLKHLRVLEEAGLVARTKEGRVVSCELSPEPIKAAADWVWRYEKFWSEKLDSLARYLTQQEELQRWNLPASKKRPSSSSSAATRPLRKKSGAPGRTRRR
ncbi:MAG: metalloregulator ArsR/SmtB family transcription factor [Betaproteobacteria bacterium]|nr:metalloregulator ArsR/SmtB family transcription factor [Betaproteobacteria bacterium]